MVAFSLFPGDSVVLIALLGLFVATFAGSMLGGMRVGMFLAATLIALPPLVLATLVQRWLISGLTLGAVKG